MTRIAERLLHSLISLMLMFTLVFVAIRAIPGDPARLMAGDSASPEQVTLIRERLGLSEPVWIQYARYLGNLVQADLGQSIRSNRPVTSEIITRVPATLLLAAVSTVIAALIGVTAGVLAAARRYSWVDVSMTSGAVATASVPSFWVALLLIDWLSINERLLPTSGIGTWQHLVMPSMVIAGTQVGTIARLTRTNVIGVLQTDFIRTAYAKGLRARQVVWGHAVRNALIPVVTVMGLQMGVALGGAVITETIFTWPGIGRLVIESVLSRDYPMIQGLVLFFGATFIFLNWLVDVINILLDPRISS